MSIPPPTLLEPWIVADRVPVIGAQPNLELLLDYDVSTGGDIVRRVRLIRHDIGFPIMTTDLVDRTDDVLAPEIGGPLSEFAVRALAPLPPAFGAVSARIISALFGAGIAGHGVQALGCQLMLELGIGADGIARLAALEHQILIEHGGSSIVGLSMSHDPVADRITALDMSADQGGQGVVRTLVRDLATQSVEDLLSWVVEAFAAAR